MRVSLNWQVMVCHTACSDDKPAWQGVDPVASPLKKGKTLVQDAAQEQGKKRSERRQKGRVLTLRVSEAEQQEIEVLAEREGLTVGSYVRSRALSHPTTRAVRRPTVEVQLLSQLLAQLGRVGSNLNQITRRVNSGEILRPADISEAIAACRHIAEQAKDALDRNT
jgi:hypothetical protein